MWNPTPILLRVMSAQAMAHWWHTYLHIQDMTWLEAVRVSESFMTKWDQARVRLVQKSLAPTSTGKVYLHVV